MDPLAGSCLLAQTSVELIPHVTGDIEPTLAFCTLSKQHRAKQLVSAGGIEKSFIRYDID